MLKLLPLLFFWYRMGAFTKPWAAPAASDADFKAMRRATRTAFFVMLGFSLLGFLGPALFPVLRHSDGARTFSTVAIIAGLVVSLAFDIKAELLRRKGRGTKRQSVYFPPSWLKKNERFSRGVDKFIAYQRDLMPAPKLNAVLEAKKEYETALRDPDGAMDRFPVPKEELKDDSRNPNIIAIERLEKKVLKVCEAAVPEYNASPLKENLEVIIVAIIVALGIRAYYLQPFKIPTASMQPTLNGIIGTPLNESQNKPNFLLQGWKYVWNGRNYVECRVPEEWGEVELTEFQQSSKLNFFTFTTLFFSNGEQITKYAPARQLLQDISRNLTVSQLSGGVSSEDNPRRVPFGLLRNDRTIEPHPIKLHGGDLIAKGYIESGDQLLVDKFSYHFRSPRRDEVFVFSTKDIPIRNQTTPQHYIKRLVALPDDKVSIQAPQLMVNGETVTAPGSSRVMSAQDGYKGYTDGSPGGDMRYGLRRPGGGIDVIFQKPGYTALGDNSGNSEDSRYWGGVPDKNIVGPAMFVYWPFANHWGLIP